MDNLREFVKKNRAAFDTEPLDEGHRGRFAAKLARAPATIFLIPALIPLVPGSYVYYMMSALVLNKLSTMRHYGQLTAEWAFGLAAGIGLIAVLHQIASWKPREKH